MQRSIRIAVLVLAMLALAAPTTQADGLVLQSGRLWLTGSSTVHDFESKASKIQVVFQHDPSRWPDGLSAGDAVEGLIAANGVRSVEVVVGVTGLHSRKSGLDKNMYKALAAEKHPEIRFAMAGYDVRKGPSVAEKTIDAKGSLTVAGVEREIPVSVTAIREGETMRLRGSVPLLMSTFGIKPPTMMMGAVRTSDKVTVHFDLVVVTKEAAAASKAE